MAKGIYRVKAVALPNMCVGVVFENITDLKATEER
jgi:hypothetical protein